MNWFMRLIRRDRLERQLDDELRFHVDQETRRLIDRGVDPAEAGRRARASFGGLEPIKEQARDARGTRWLEDFWHDMRYAGRMMRRSPVFTLAAVASLAVGIGANAAVFNVADALLLRSLPVSHPEQLAFLNQTGFKDLNTRFSYPGLEAMRGAAGGARLAAMSRTATMQLSRSQGARLLLGQLVTGDWFDLLGVRAAAGRLIGPADTQQLGGAPVAVLSDRFWESEFARDPAIVGSTIVLNRVSLAVIGVAPPGFDGVYLGERVAVWLPVTLQHELRYRSNASMDDADGNKPWLPQDGVQWLTVVVRAESASQRTAALAALNGVNRVALERHAAQADNPERRKQILASRIEFLEGGRGLSNLRDDFENPLLVLMGTVGVVLLIACANLASLLLARSSARGREIALRMSLGARRGRLVRQLLTESLALACLGGAAGLAVAQWGGAALLRLASGASGQLPLDLAADWRFVGFTVLVSLATGALFGLAPAIRLSRPGFADSLKSGGRIVAASDRQRRLSFGKVLVAAQMALSLMLLVGAVLFLRTFRNLLAVDAGFEQQHVVTARFDPRLAGFNPEQLPSLYQRLLDEARSIPSVRSASLALSGPVTGSARISDIVVEGRPHGVGPVDDVREEFVGADYFATLGMSLAKGRDFAISDAKGSPSVAIVNETLARHFFGDASPLGRRFGYDIPADTEIVGVVRDARIDGFRRPAPPTVYRLLSQHPEEFARNLYIRVAGATDAARVELQRAVARADKNLAVREVVTLADLAERTVSIPRLISALTSAFGLLAVALACLGLYGTVSYSVARRTNEIGVRLALGASPAGVRWMILRETLAVSAIGSAAGLLMLLPVLTYVGTLLYGLSPRDPATLVFATVSLVTAAGLAGALPAWRASRVDPVVALRAE